MEKKLRALGEMCLGPKEETQEETTLSLSPGHRHIQNHISHMTHHKMNSHRHVKNHSHCLNKMNAQRKTEPIRGSQVFQESLLPLNRRESSLFQECYIRASLIAQLVKNLPARQETPVQFLGWEDPLEKG